MKQAAGIACPLNFKKGGRREKSSHVNLILKSKKKNEAISVTDRGPL
jgi:hypothetical protein